VAPGAADLDGTVTDDGLPDPPGIVTVSWEQTGGPAVATIDDPGSVDTTVLLPDQGEYAFTLTADDGQYTSQATVTLTATTAPGPGQTIRFAAIGDYGDGGSKEAQVAEMIDGWGADFIITSGDNVVWGSGTFDEKVAQFYFPYIGDYAGIHGPGADVNRFFPSLGNHDYTDGEGLDGYLAFFTFPGIGVATTGTSGNERYYDFRQGPVHFFVINSNQQEPDGTSPDSVQGNWLQNQIAASEAPWKVVYFHHSPYSSAGHGPSEFMQWPFSEWGADLVVTGHNHMYERLLVGDLTFIVSGLGVNHYELTGPVSDETQAFYSEDDAGALLVIACDNAVLLEYRALVAGVVDTYQLGTGACPDG